MNDTQKSETPAALDSMRLLSGVELIAAERQRQIEKEGWSAEHDDEHTSACLAVAGACYALQAAAKSGEVHGSWKKIYHEQSERLWPFDSDPWWKPSPDPVRDLVKAGALIAAEIDRLNRKNLNASSDNHSVTGTQSLGATLTTGKPDNAGAEP